MPIRKKAASRDHSDDELEIGEAGHKMDTDADQAQAAAEKENMAKGVRSTGASKKRPAAAAKAADVTVIPESQDAGTRTGTAQSRLESKIQILERMNKTLEAKFNELYERRHTEPEQALEAFTEIANKRAALATEQHTALVQENATIKEENSLLRKGIAPESHAEREELDRARVELASLRTQLEQAQRQLKTSMAENDKLHESERRKWDAKKDKLQEELHHAKKALEDVQRKSIKPLQDEVNVLKTELRAEIELSKSLQAKVKGVSSFHAVPTATSDAAAQKVAAEYEDLRTRAELMEDLTGFTVHSKRNHGQEQVTYTCTFSDYLAEHSLAFKLTFGSEGDMQYEPDLESERDKRLLARLPVKYRASFRIEADYCSIFFRNLYGSLNSVRSFDSDGADFPVL